MRQRAAPRYVLLILAVLSSAAWLLPGCARKQPLKLVGQVEPAHRISSDEAAVAPVALPAQPGSPTTLIVAAWNVENLFDTEDDPLNDGDDEFTPGGWRRWTTWRYALKLRNLARVIARMQPDILCLSEIENRRVLEDLRHSLQVWEGYELPCIFQRDSSDPRGIDVAMMSRYEAVRVDWIRTATRETLVCDFNIAGHELTVLANHWRSHLGEKRVADAIRRRDAQAVRNFLDLRLAVNSNAAIVVAGDFNDDVISPVLTETAGFKLKQQQVLQAPGAGWFYNLAGGLSPQSRATFWYNAGKRWDALDSISVSRGMLLAAEDGATSWRVVPDSYRVFKIPEQVDEDGYPIPFRFVRSKAKGNAYKTGYSDHFPVCVELKVQQNDAPDHGKP